MLIVRSLRSDWKKVSCDNEIYGESRTFQCSRYSTESQTWRVIEPEAVCVSYAAPLIISNISCKLTTLSNSRRHCAFDPASFNKHSWCDMIAIGYALYKSGIKYPCAKPHKASKGHQASQGNPLREGVMTGFHAFLA